MGIETKTTSFLIDQLVTTLMKCFFAQETIMNSEDTEEVAKAAKQAQQLNSRRNQLLRVLDVRFEEADLSFTEKTYTK